MVGSVGKDEGEICSVENLDGDATICQRKGKLFCIYDLSFEFEFKSDECFKFSFRDVLSDCSDYLDFEVSVSPSGIDEKMKEQVLERVFQCFEQMKRDACEQQGKELVGQNATTSETKTTTTKEHKFISGEQSIESSSGRSGKFAVETLKMKLTFNCPSAMIWDCLFDSAKCDAWSHTKGSQVEPISGHPYRMFDGNISGTFISANLHHSAKFTWRHASWPSSHFSTVEMKFDDLHGEGRILFEQTEVPTSELERTRDNWNQYIWSPIKALFGYTGGF